MLVLRARQICPGQTQGDAQEDFSKGETGHSEGSSVRRYRPILGGLIGVEDSVFAGPARMYRKRRECTPSAVPGRRDLRFNDNAHKLPQAPRGASQPKGEGCRKLTE